MLGLSNYEHFSDKPQILVAGCGTGQNAIASASCFKDSQVTAIDLSLSSLGYAKRKTKEFGLQNIKYLQGDILCISRLQKTFDIIECVGVLHHMSEPKVGPRTTHRCIKARRIDEARSL